MTDAETRLDARQRKRLLPWATRAVQLVSRKLADARSHAENAVTQTLKGAPDGRPSLAVIRRSPSFTAAASRLEELWAAIGGSAVTSLTGQVHDATEDFYQDARRYWWREVPEEYRVSSPDPTQAQLTYVRGLLWFGMPIRQDFAPQFKRVYNNLTAALGAAGSNSNSSIGQPQITSLRTWEIDARDTLIQRFGLALNDANQRADLQAMKDTMRPEFQHES